MKIKKEAILDLTTGEVTYTDFTKEELENYQAKQADYEAQQMAKQEAIEGKKAAKEAAIAKLAALGLTPEEISAITGA
jgi:predicted YcjX-like family ATPase